MDEKRKIDFVIKATDEASPTIDRVAQRMKQIQRGLEDDKIDKLARKKLGLGGGLDGLKEVFGARGGFKDIGELLAGGGAIAGIGFATHLLGEFTKGMVEAKDAANDINKNWADITQQIGRAVPVLGGIVDVGEQINNAVTGNLDHLKEVREEADRIKTVFEGWKIAIDVATQGQADINVLAGNALQERARAEHPEIANDPHTKVMEQFSANRTALQKTRQNALDKIDDELAKMPPSERNSAWAKKWRAQKEDEINDAFTRGADNLDRARGGQDTQISQAIAKSAGSAIVGAASGFFGNLLGGAKSTVAGPVTGLIGLFEGLASRRKGGVLPAGISDALPTLQSSGTGIAESARDRLGIMAAHDRNEAARIRKKQAEDVEKMKKALEYIRDQIAKGNPANALTALFSPR